MEKFQHRIANEFRTIDSEPSSWDIWQILNIKIVWCFPLVKIQMGKRRCNCMAVVAVDRASYGVDGRCRAITAPAFVGKALATEQAAE